MRDIGRRSFLQQVGAAAVVGGLGPAPARRQEANEKVVLALIGGKNRGWQIAAEAIAQGAVFKTLCDVDDAILGSIGDSLRERQGREVGRTRTYQEVLDDPDIDAVLIATPDHWHGIQLIQACQAGKDVYIEKPLTQSIHEGQQMLKAARKHRRVVQMGTQRRSDARYAAAVEYAAAGHLGKVCLFKGWSTTLLRADVGRPPDSQPPAGVDYDRWLGPAPSRPFNRNRFHYTWRYYWDYGTGEMGNMGVHALDICAWAIEKLYGRDRILPRRVSGTAGKYWLDDDKDIPDTQTVTFDHGGFMTVWELMCFQRGYRPHGLGHGAAFYGTEGTLVADSGELIRPDGSTEKVIEDSGGSHLGNFLDCVKSRELPHADVATGRLSTNLCLLGNIAGHLKRDVHFDPATETFGDDAEANALLHKSYRPPYVLPEV